MQAHQPHEKETDRTLRALDGMERAAPLPFFFTRVQVRLARRHAAGTAGHWAFRPALLAASLSAILLLNASAVAVYAYRLAGQEQQQAAETFAGEWGADPATFDWE
ncbi:MAG: hypothetical protein ICV83_26370 [Cytophagales bacterium]|nr:hypothetical protein [Cytophagales bacterium]